MGAFVGAKSALVIAAFCNFRDAFLPPRRSTAIINKLSDGALTRR
jgi:hypothetical protein